MESGHQCFYSDLSLSLFSFSLLFPHDNRGPIPRCSHHSQRLQFLSLLLSFWLISSVSSSFYTNLNFSVEANPATFPALTFIVSTLLFTFWCTVEFIYLLNLAITVYLSSSKNIRSTRTEHWFIQSCVSSDQNSDGTWWETNKYVLSTPAVLWPHLHH